MNKAVAEALRLKIADCSQQMSNLNRSLNFNGETFHVSSTVVLSEHGAAVHFLKTPSNKVATAFFYFNNKRWFYYFPDDSTIYAMALFGEQKQKTEQHNFKTGGGC